MCDRWPSIDVLPVDKMMLPAHTVAASPDRIQGALFVAQTGDLLAETTCQPIGRAARAQATVKAATWTQGCPGLIVVPLRGEPRAAAAPGFEDAGRGGGGAEIGVLGVGQIERTAACLQQAEACTDMTAPGTDCSACRRRPGSSNRPGAIRYRESVLMLVPAPTISIVELPVPPAAAPLSASGSATVRPPPWTCRVAPLAMIVPSPAAPRAAPFSMFSVPELRVVKPV